MQSDDHFIEYFFDESTKIKDLIRSDQNQALLIDNLYDDLEVWGYAGGHLFNCIEPINFFGIVYNSLRMQLVVDLIVLKSDEVDSVLITGETGTGKSECALAIRYTSSRRNNRYIRLNCSDFSKKTVISELFGHERGSFTGAFERKIGILESYDNGTIFLDEIDSLDPSVQANLLSYLDDKMFRRLGGTSELFSDVKLIFATNKELSNKKEGEEKSGMISIIEFTKMK